ncbi:MAG: hypothetical protein ACJAYU_002040 [Bradymonadia bacterium]|jgi:hypothetical protein
MNPGSATGDRSFVATTIAVVIQEIAGFRRDETARDAVLAGRDTLASALCETEFAWLTEVKHFAAVREHAIDVEVSRLASANPAISFDACRLSVVDHTGTAAEPTAAGLRQKVHTLVATLGKIAALKWYVLLRIGYVQCIETFAQIRVFAGVRVVAGIGRIGVRCVGFQNIRR